MFFNNIQFKFLKQLKIINVKKGRLMYYLVLKSCFLKGHSVAITGGIMILDCYSMSFFAKTISEDELIRILGSKVKVTVTLCLFVPNVL